MGQTGFFTADAKNRRVFCAADREAEMAQFVFQGLNTAHNLGLWVSDGTVAGTHEITGINGAFSAGVLNAQNPDLTPFNGEFVFDGNNSSGVRSLWVTDLTAGGTHEITGIFGASTNGLDPHDITVFNGKILFAG